MGGNNEEVQKEKRPSGDTPIEAIRASRPAKTADGIREWFSTLSVEDRASALGFVDDTILSALLKHALLASSFSSHNIESIPGSRTDKNGKTNFFSTAGTNLSPSIRTLFYSIPWLGLPFYLRRCSH